MRASRAALSVSASSIERTSASYVADRSGWSWGRTRQQQVFRGACPACAPSADGYPGRNHASCAYTHSLNLYSRQKRTASLLPECHVPSSQLLADEQPCPLMQRSSARQRVVQAASHAMSWSKPEAAAARTYCYFIVAVCICEYRSKRKRWPLTDAFSRHFQRRNSSSRHSTFSFQRTDPNGRSSMR